MNWNDAGRAEQASAVHIGGSAKAGFWEPGGGALEDLRATKRYAAAIGLHEGAHFVCMTASGRAGLIRMRAATTRKRRRVLSAILLASALSTVGRERMCGHGCSGLYVSPRSAAALGLRGRRDARQWLIRHGLIEREPLNLCVPGPAAA